MEGLNAMPPDQVATELAACCASRRWIAAVTRARPFGSVEDLLIRATGRTAPQMLAAALERLGHDEQTEQAVVREELSQIVRLRLDKLLLGLAEGTRSR